MNEPPLSRLIPGRLSARIPGRKSELHAWYVREWETLRGGEINWRWLLGEIAKRKLTDRTGRPPTLQTARQTWYRVKREMEKCDEMRPPIAKPRSHPAPKQSRQPLSAGVTRQFIPATIKE